MCGCLSCAHYWGPGLQPRHVPWLGINLQCFDSQAHTQSTELHQPGPFFFFKNSYSFVPWKELVALTRLAVFQYHFPFKWTGAFWWNGWFQGLAENGQDELGTSQTTKLPKTTGVLSKGQRSQYKGLSLVAVRTFWAQKKNCTVVKQIRYLKPTSLIWYWK